MITQCYLLITVTTRQSEMTNTSPRHMSVLGNVHPIQIKFRDVISLLSRRGSHETYLKEIVFPVFEIYAIELLGSMSDKA